METIKIYKPINNQNTPNAGKITLTKQVGQTNSRAWSE